MDKAAIIKNAQKFLSKGQIDKAIAEWQKVASSYPDGNTFNFLGDLYLKKGDKNSAADEFHKAAKIYMNEGFSLKALAIFKKILNIDPYDTSALMSLGKLNEEKNIVTDAIKYYLAAADALSKKKKRDELLNVYEKILNLAPKNIQLRIKVAELFSKEGFVAEAAREYCSIGRLHGENGDAENARTYLAKAAEIQPNNTDVLVELSVLSERSGNLDEAINSIQSALENNENAALHLRNAQLLSAKGSLEEAAQSLSKVVELEPDNSDARKLMADLYQRSGDLDKAWQEYSVVIDSLMSITPEEAMDILARFKDFDPIDNRKRLASLYKQAGDEANAFNELYGLCDEYLQKGMKSEARRSIEEALAIQPDNMDAQARLREISEAGADAPGAGPAPPVEETVQAAGQEDEQEKPLEVALTEADVFLRYGLYNDARALLEGLKAKHPESIDLHRKLKTLYVDTNDAEQAVTECIVLSNLCKRSGDEASSRAFLEEARKLNPTDPRLEGSAPAAAAPQAKASSLADYSQDLSEADFYVQQGFYTEAANVYRKLVELFPDNSDLRAKLADAERQISEAPSGFEEDTGTESFTLDDLGISEFEGFDTQGPEEPALGDDIQEIFNEFKKGLANEIEAEDAETHYNLGIAYKEMGLVDDAIKEFQTCQRDPNFYVTSTTMVGLCLMQKGLFSKAIEAFSGALSKTAPGDETSWSLKYDLGTAHEKNGDSAQAIQMFTEVHTWNPNFRDVSARLNELKKGGDAPAAPSSPDTSEGPSSPDTQAGAKEVPPSAPKKDKRSRVSYI